MKVSGKNRFLPLWTTTFDVVIKTPNYLEKKLGPISSEARKTRKITRY